MDHYWEQLLNSVQKNKDNKQGLSVKECPPSGYAFAPKFSQPKKCKRRISSRIRFYPFGMDKKTHYLTPREAQCAEQILQGFNVPQTANRLNLSKRTVEFYLKKSKARLGYHSNAALVKGLRNSAFPYIYPSAQYQKKPIQGFENTGQAARK